MTEYPKRRNLDGCYFRVERDGKFENLCFTDLTEEERFDFCSQRSAEWLRSLALHLGEIVRLVGDSMDVEFVERGGDDE